MASAQGFEPVIVGLTCNWCSYREQKRIVLDKAWKIDPENLEEVLASGGYRGLEKILSSSPSPAAVIEEVKKSGLRGRGGAGFPTGMKWEFTRRAPGDENYVICNADEGEPGTFKDRLILEGDPHKLIEGMEIAGYAIGSRKGYIYIRGEYDLSIRRMQKAMDQARQSNLLAEEHPGNRVLLLPGTQEGSRGLRMRGGNGAHRIAGGKTGQPAPQTPLPRHPAKSM